MTPNSHKDNSISSKSVHFYILFFRNTFGLYDWMCVKEKHRLRNQNKLCGTKVVFFDKWKNVC